MAGVIVLSGQEVASNTDILQGTRLQTVPAGGMLTLEIEADLNDATNNYTCTLQLPDGDTPLNAVRVPANGAGADGVIDEREKLMFSALVGQGGHPVFSVTETGTAVVSWRVTFTPARLLARR